MTDNETCFDTRESVERVEDQDDIENEIIRWERTEISDIKRFINHFQIFRNVLYDEQIDMIESDEIRLFNIYVSNRG